MGGSTNPDPWNWGGDDPTWNYNSSNDPIWSGYDNSSGYGSGYSQPQQMNFLERQLQGVLTQNYTSKVLDEINQVGIYNDETVDIVADRIINKYARHSMYYGVAASLGVSLMDYLFLDQWRLGSGVMGSLGSYALYGAATSAVLIPESFAVMQQQLAMLLEIMELYGQLPANPYDRASEVSAAQNLILGVTAGNTFVSRLLGIGRVIGQKTPPTGEDPIPVVKATETVLEQTGLSSAQEAEKTSTEIVAKSGLETAATQKFGATKVGEWLAKQSPILKSAAAVTFSSALWAASSFISTKMLGNHYKRLYRKLSRFSQHNLIETLKDRPDAKHALWLILTKNVFKPKNAYDSLRVRKNKKFTLLS